MPSPDVQVFATEADSLQLCWPRLPERKMTFEVAGQRFEVDATPPDWFRVPVGRRSPGGPGSVVVTGLEPATSYDVVVGGRKVAVGLTMAALPGRALARFATISDCHIGEQRVGLLRTLHDPRPRPAGLDPYPVRCALAAIAEAEEWGAELIVAKGDLTNKSEPEEAQAAAGVLASAHVPVEALLGNHDVRQNYDVASVLASRGVRSGVGARTTDVARARLVFGHTPVPGSHEGRLDRAHARELVDLAGSARGPAVVVMHHPPRRRRFNTYYPPAITWRDSTWLVASLYEANPATVVLAGHTHRNRRYRAGAVEVAEVGSTKDYPGQWAGYTVFEGGIRQVVRRTSRPDVIAWTERTRWALGGVWGRWSPGTLEDRCWTLSWPRAR